MKKKDIYARLVRTASKDPEAYWEAMALQCAWFAPWKRVLEWKEPHAKWFVEGKTNIAYNALDVHLSTSKKDKIAIIWEGERGEKRTLTYTELHAEVCRLSNTLESLGIKKGDVVAIYMAMIPEAVIAMLACARIGAVHNVVFGGFSGNSLRDRINDSNAKIVICSDGGYRRGKHVPLKDTVDEALSELVVKHVIVVKHTREPVVMKKGRDLWWSDVIAKASPEHTARKMDAEDPLFMLYTSGSTGKPKGILHTTGGYMVHAKSSFEYIFQPKENDIYWCTADVGWITGHTYVTYGPLLAGTTVFLYEGALNHPDWGRVWSIIEKHRISILYTAPTAVRSFIKAGDAWVTSHNLSSLRLLGSVGEPINPEVWKWFSSVVGGGRCPVVDTWWQTETGGIMISPIPHISPRLPGSATTPLPGISVDILSEDGKRAKIGEVGYLVITKPWPSMLRTIFGDDARYKKTYWSQFPHVYFSGDAAKRDKNGNIWIIGRVDDVVNVSGHRIGTAEVESALVSHHAVAEAAVVARPDPITGSAIVAFVTVKNGKVISGTITEELKNHVGKTIGPIAKPSEVRILDALPKTRSGKIMRRILREISVAGTVTGDMSTLEDMSIIEDLKRN